MSNWQVNLEYQMIGNKPYKENIINNNIKYYNIKEKYNKD
jgi:hypothetical protein